MNSHKQIWYDPVYTNTHIEKLLRTVDHNSLNKDQKYQKPREARIGMIVALILYEITGNPHYLRVLNKKEEPPDIQLMFLDPKSVGTIICTNLEISTFRSSSKENFLQQLKRKVPSNFHKYTEKEMLIYHVDSFSKIDTKSAHEYLLKVKPPFPVWLIKISKDFRGNTIAEIFVIYQKYFNCKINVAQSAYNFVQANHPAVLRTLRTAGQKNVRITLSEIHTEAPWDNNDT